MMFTHRVDINAVLDTRAKILDDNGFDVTPKPLSFTPLQTKRKPSVRSKYEGSELDGSRLGTRAAAIAIAKSAAIMLAAEKDYLKELEIVKENLKTCKLDMEEATVKPETSVLYLEESDYQWHLHIPSTNYLKMEEAEIQTESTEEKPKRYCLSTAAQTYNPVSKKKITQTAPIEMSTSCVFASEWDLYDTYRRLSYEDEEAEFDDSEFDLEIHGMEMASKDPVAHQRPSVTSESTLSQSNELQPIIASRRANIQANKVIKLPEFQYAVAVAERLISSNTFHNQQIDFMSTINNLQEMTTGFHYIMNELWSFSYEDSKNRIVNAVCWNTANVNVVAVGYGYLRDADQEDGLVCCWNVKNPSKPERVFPTISAVTTLSFSQTRPNLLALGCLNGAIIVLNISSKTGDKLVINGEEGCLLYGPVGHLQWFFHTDFVVETEEIISVGRNGRVYKWNYQESFRSYEIMKLNYFQPNLKVPVTNHKAKNKSKNTVKFLNGLSVSLHPKKKMIYYVSTLEGCIIKCAMNCHSRFEDIFPAHAGPVYGILHAPFCPSIFCTYGSDWYVCIWAEDFKEPLLKLYYIKQPVLGVSWSPNHSTILATISGHYLSLWDLARKAIVPVSTVKSSSGNVFTSIQFSSTGKNILVGDVTGQVFVFNLADMPYPPFLQEEALILALQKALVGKPKHCSFLDTFIKDKTVEPADLNLK